MKTKLAVLLLASSMCSSVMAVGGANTDPIDRRASVLVNRILSSTSQLPAAERRKAVSIGLNRWFKPLTIHVPDAITNLIPASSNLIKVIEDPKNNQSFKSESGMKPMSLPLALSAAGGPSPPNQNGQFLNYDPMHLMNFDPNSFMKAIASAPPVSFDGFNHQNGSSGFQGFDDSAAAASAMFPHFPSGMMGDESSKAPFTSNMYDDDSRMRHNSNNNNKGGFNSFNSDDRYGSMHRRPNKFPMDMDDSTPFHHSPHHHSRPEAHFHRPASNFFQEGQGTGYGRGGGNIPTTHMVSGSGNYDYHQQQQPQAQSQRGYDDSVGLGGMKESLNVGDHQRDQRPESNYESSMVYQQARPYSQYEPQQQQQQPQSQSASAMAYQAPAQYGSSVGAGGAAVSVMDDYSQADQVELQRVPQYHHLHQAQVSQASQPLKETSDLNESPSAYFREYSSSPQTTQTLSYALNNDTLRYADSIQESFYNPGKNEESSNIQDYNDQPKSTMDANTYSGYYQNDGYQSAASALAPVVVKTNGEQLSSSDDVPEKMGGFVEPLSSSGGFVPMTSGYSNIFPRAQMKTNSPRPVATRFKAFIKNMLVQKN